MFNIETANNNSILLITNQNKLILLNNLHDESSLEKQIYEHTTEITAVAFLKNKSLIAITDLNKKFLLLDVANNFNILATKSINKRAAKLISNKTESVIILGDKTGDVYSLSLDALESSEFKLIMGHLSMLTDMNLSSDEKYLFTSDRDEKIRISHFPNTYNVHSYLLAHKEFVSQIEFIDENYLLSASGDSKVIVWNLEQVNPVQIINLKDICGEELKDEELVGVDRFDYNKNSNTLCVHPFGANFLLSFDYNPSEKQFKFQARLSLSHSIDVFVRILDNYYLFGLFDESSDIKFAIRKLIDNKITEIDLNSGVSLDAKIKSIETVLYDNCDIKKLKDSREDIKNNYLNYFTSKVDNIGEYYGRKNERIATMAAAKKQKLSDHKHEAVAADLDDPIN